MRTSKISLVTFVLLVLLGTMLSTVAGAKAKMVMWTLAGASETYKKIHEALLPGFGKAFGDVDLELHYIPDYAEKYIVAYAAGTAPDIVTLPTRYQAEYIEKKMVVPIDLAAFNVKSEAELAKMMMPGTMETLRYRDNHIYFMATEISVFGLFCNNDLMGQYGVGSVPTTWEEMLEVGRKFLKTDGDGKTTQIGFGIPRGWIWPTFTWTSLMRQYGVEPISNDNRPQFSQPGSMKAINMYQELFRRASDPAASSGTFFSQGRSAFDWNANYNVFGYMAKQPLFEVGSAPLPKFADGIASTVSYGFGHFVSAQSKQTELAWKVIAFFDGPQTAEQWYTDVSLWHPWRGAWIERIFKIEPLHRPFLESLEFAKAEVSHPQIRQIHTLWGQAETRIMSGSMGVETSLQKLDDDIGKIIGP